MQHFHIVIKILQFFILDLNANKNPENGMENAG